MFHAYNSPHDNMDLLINLHYSLDLKPLKFNQNHFIAIKAYIRSKFGFINACEKISKDDGKTSKRIFIRNHRS
jgi:hypothetical protein